MKASRENLEWTPEEYDELLAALPDDRTRERIIKLFADKHAIITTQLRSSEQQFRQVINAQDDLVCRYDRQCRLTFVNEAYARHHNIPPQQLIGRVFIDLLESELKTWAREVTDDIFANPRPLRHITKMVIDGNVRWYDWSDTPILDEWGEVSEVQTVGRNITVLKELELLAKQQEARLRLIMDHIPMGAIIMFDNDLRYTFVAGEALTAIGRSREDYENYTLQEAIPDELHNQLEAIYRETLEGHSLENEITFQDRVYSFRTAPVYDTNGDITGGVVSAHDVTERKILDQQELGLQVEQEQKRVIVDFIRDASHEFRTPLTIMQSSLYIMRKSDDIDKIHARIDKITQQIQYLTNLIDALVLMARLDSNAQTEAMWQIDLNFIVRSVIERFRTDPEVPQITFELEDIPETYANHNDIALALSEIITNAMHATPPDGTIHIAMTSVDNSVHITISDNGNGIAEEDLPNIWKRFFRGSDAHLSRGFGLGLPIAKRIAQLHGGDLNLTSQHNEGTTVTFVLPIRTSLDTIES